MQANTGTCRMSSSATLLDADANRSAADQFIEDMGWPGKLVASLVYSVAEGRWSMEKDAREDAGTLQTGMNSDPLSELSSESICSPPFCSSLEQEMITYNCCADSLQELRY